MRGTQTFGQVLFGILIATFGTLILLDNFDIMEADELFQYWPAIPLAVGLVKLASPAGSERLFGLALTVIFGTLLVDRFYPLAFEPWDLWPLVLVLVGGSIAWRAFRGPAAQTEAALGGRAAPAGDPASVVKETAILAGINHRNVSQAFRGGEASAVMGGCELDLRGARIAEGGATIDVFAMWGGVVLQVPPDWRIDSQVTAIAGAVEDKTHPTPGTANRLVVRGTVVMGGVEFKN